MALTSKLEFV